MKVTKRSGLLEELDIKKIEQLQNKLQDRKLREVYGELPEGMLHFLNNNIINYCLHENKTGIKQGYPVRVVNSWLAQEVIKVREEDKGKIRRFDKLENIWLNIVFDARKLGISIEVLKNLRKKLFDSPLNNFSLFKLGVIKTIFSMPQVLVFSLEGNAEMLSFEAYNKWFAKKKLPAHSVFLLEEYIAKEYNNIIFSRDFDFGNQFSDKNKMLLSYFLKTGDYKYIKIHLGEGDIRGIESSKSLLHNPELLKTISDFQFQKAEIIINNEVETIIKMEL